MVESRNETGLEGDPWHNLANLRGFSRRTGACCVLDEDVTKAHKLIGDVDEVGDVGRGAARHRLQLQLSIEVIGDRWSLLVIRDMMFGNRRHSGELLAGSDEGIVSSILADRLRRLTDQGLVSRAPDPPISRKLIYSLTEPTIQLVPVLAQLGAWGRTSAPLPSSRPSRAAGGRWSGAMEEFMAELRDSTSVSPAYEAELAKLERRSRSR